MLSKSNKIPKINFEIGQTVKVKKGVMCPDHENLCLENYQGLVTDFGEEEDGALTVCIEWDAISLKNLPEDYISESITEGLAYQMMYLYPDEVEAAEQRSTEEEMMTIQDEIFEKYKWSGYEGLENVILEVVKDIEPEESLTLFNTWKDYLNKKLIFPFEAEIAQFLGKGKLRQGDILKVLNIDFIDEEHGMIVAVKKGNNKYFIPLSDLEVIDKTSENYSSLKAYTIWFEHK